MYKDQDPLNHIYSKLLRESVGADHTQGERDKTGRATYTPIVEPGLHVVLEDEVRLKDGSIVPAEVFFHATYEQGNIERIDGRSYKTSDAGWVININKIIIPATTQEDVDLGTVQPGVYKPGQDITQLVTQQCADHISENLGSYFSEHQQDHRDVE